MKKERIKGQKGRGVWDNRRVRAWKHNGQEQGKQIKRGGCRIRRIRGERSGREEGGKRMKRKRKERDKETGLKRKERKGDRKEEEDLGKKEDMVN